MKAVGRLPGDLLDRLFRAHGVDSSAPCPGRHPQLCSARSGTRSVCHPQDLGILYSDCIHVFLPSVPPMALHTPGGACFRSVESRSYQPLSCSIVRTSQSGSVHHRMPPNLRWCSRRWMACCRHRRAIRESGANFVSSQNLATMIAF